MKYCRFLWWMVPVAVLATIFMMAPGCEHDPEMTDVDQYFADHPEIQDPRVAGSKPLNVTPANASVSVAGQKISFRAMGGPSAYTWGVATPGNGTITASRQSDSAVYTALRVAPNTVIVSDSRGQSAIVQITVASSGALQIVPSAYTFTAAETNGLPLSVEGSTLDFTVVGGAAPYGEWRVVNAGLGTIAKLDETHARYTAHGSWGTGDNTVTVTDSAGKLTTATVTIEYKH